MRLCLLRAFGGGKKRNASTASTQTSTSFTHACQTKTNMCALELFLRPLTSLSASKTHLNVKAAELSTQAIISVQNAHGRQQRPVASSVGGTSAKRGRAR